MTSCIHKDQNNTNSVNALDIQNNVVVGQFIKTEDFHLVPNHETSIHKIKMSRLVKRGQEHETKASRVKKKTMRELTQECSDICGQVYMV